MNTVHHTTLESLRDLEIPSFEEGDQLPEPPPPAGGLDVHLLLDDGLAAYLYWLVASDVAAWQPARQCKLTRQEASIFALFLFHQLPEAIRARLLSHKSIPPLPSQTQG